MFLNKTRFKKLLKSAYTHGGLTVGRVYEGLVLAGNGWVSWTEEGYVPNWLKAAVIEYTGELPKAGYVFRAQKDEVLQYEMPENDRLDLPGCFTIAKEPYEITPITYNTSLVDYRMLQNRKDGGLIIFPEYFYETLDFSELDKDEFAPTGPSAYSLDPEMLYWKNEHAAVAFSTAKTGDIACIKAKKLLAEIDFGEKVK